MANPKLDAIYRIAIQRESPKKLKAYLWSDDPKIKISALQAIGTMRNREAVRVLETLKDISNTDVKIQYAKAAMVTPGSDDLCLARFENEESPSIRSLWLDCLGLQGSQKHLPILQKSILHTNRLSMNVERLAALRAIGRLAARNESDFQVLKPLIINQMDDIDTRIRREAAIALASHKLKQQSKTDISGLLQIIDKESDPQALMHLIRMTKKMQIPQKTLETWYQHSSPMVRIAAIKTHSQNAFVKQMIKDDSFHVRLAAIKALAINGKSLKGVIRKGATITALEDSKMGVNTHLAEAVAAIESAKVGDFSPFPLLANSRPTLIRKAAVKLIDNNRSLLEYALDDREAEVRKAAAEVLLTRNPKPSTIAKLLRSKDINLASAAASELTRSPKLTQEMELWKRLQKTQSKKVALLLIEALAALEKTGNTRQSKAKVKKYLKPWMKQPEARFQKALTTICRSKGVSQPKRPPPPNSNALQKTQDVKGARIETTIGTIRLKMLPELAPIAVNSFANLAESGFYEGISFNRIAPNFVVQTSPKVSEQNELTIIDEPSSIPFKMGSVGMAMRVVRSRSNGKRRRLADSGGRHFFIALSPQAHLMGKYTQFAKVVEGLGLIKQLRPEDKITRIHIERISK